jgi:hypothetical protein
MRFLSISILTLCLAPAIFAATPVTPEPATMLLMGGGLLALGAIAWRKNRKK